MSYWCILVRGIENIFRKNAKVILSHEKLTEGLLGPMIQEPLEWWLGYALNIRKTQHNS